MRFAICDGRPSQGALDKSGRHALSPADFADATGEDELDLAAADFLVEAHRGEEAFELSSTELHVRRQAGAVEDLFDPPDLSRRQAE